MYLVEYNWCLTPRILSLQILLMTGILRLTNTPFRQPDI